MGSVTTAVLVAGAAVIYGCDVFAALVLRPAAARAADASIADLVGWIHHFGDRRLPVPFAVAVLAAATGALLATGAVARGGAALALAALLAWLVLFLRVSAPVNRSLRAAAAAGAALQRRWESVLWARTALQTVALGALLVAAVAQGRA
jgi:hypothetical protein